MHRDLWLEQSHEDLATVEVSTLQSELEAAQKTIRDLRRQARKAQERYDELARAYKLTVANLVKSTNTCMLLERDRDVWRQRAEDRTSTPDFLGGRTALSSAELAAIRKAMARLHHPDTGGDVERMKAWNTLLDELECDSTHQM